MFRRNLALFALAAITALVIAGCGAATPVPAPVLPTQPPQVITVIITATPPPATATSSAPSITPLPTVNVTTTAQTAATETKPTAVAGATKPAVVATKKPAPPAASATPSPLPMKFGAPVLNRPIWNDNQKDEVKFMGGAIVFDWQSVGGLNGDECYLVQATAEAVSPVPVIGTQSDSWVTNCGDQTAPGFAVKFTLESPNRAGTAPNYSSVLINTGQIWLHWSITVVKNLGQCDPSYQYHCKTAPISAPGKAYFLFKGS